MRKSLAKIALLAVCVCIGFNCSDDGNDHDGKPVRKEKISGVSQKGPFVEGSAITISELTQNGHSFNGIITDDKGSFEIENVDFVSPYAMFEVDGNYRNEVTGEVSKSPIKLYAIADIADKSAINVNILTHLEYSRVQKLIDGGKSLKDAKKQAQKEILAVFGISGSFANSEDMSIFGTTDGDAALLAVSILLQGNLSEDLVAERLTDFSNGFMESEKDNMADWAATANLQRIRNYILGWGLSSVVPNFEKYIRDYWYTNYGIVKVCNADAENSIVNSNREVEFICRGGYWQRPKQTFTDSRDKKSYTYVKIGEQTWMAENLNHVVEGSRCYDNQDDNCKKYGCLYNWETAMKVCPSGWHLPSDADWNVLMKFINPSCNDNKNCTGAGIKLRASDGWYSSSGVPKGTDDYGFSALPGGEGNSYDHFKDVGDYGHWWSTSEMSSDYAYRRSINYLEGWTYWSYGDKSSLFSVRCLQD